MKKFLLIVFIISIPILGIIWLAQDKQEKTVQQKEETLSNSETVETEYFEPSQQTIKQLINKILPAQFDVKNAEYTISNLNEDNTPELIITAIEQLGDPFSPPSTALIRIVSVLNPEEEYESMGRLEYQELLRGR